ncbi:MAG: hypothetical protein HFJ09_11945 [Lachnospiraceae bacterium]|nr:hypothetical protein [Lachnospiraceae bacterium]
MTIEELSSKTNNKYVTVTFTYDEIRDIANGLYYVSDSEFKSIKNKAKFLFDMVKCGMVRPKTVKSMNDVLEESEQNANIND